MRTGQGPICSTVTGAIWPLSSYTCVIPTLRPIKPSGMAHHLLARETDTRGTVLRPCHNGCVHRKSYYGRPGRIVQGSVRRPDGRKYYILETVCAEVAAPSP